MANDTDYGLAATIVTGDHDRAERVSRSCAPARCGSTASSSATSRPRSAAAAGPASAARAAPGRFDFYCDVKNTVFAPKGWS